MTSSNRPLYLHFVQLPSDSDNNVINLCINEDYCVVAGLTRQITTVYPLCPDMLYVVPGGVEGLPYLPGLGREGARLDFTFPETVQTLVVVTHNNLRPIAETGGSSAEPTVVQAQKTDMRNYFPTHQTYIAVVSLKLSNGASTTIYLNQPQGVLSYPGDAAFVGHTVKEFLAAGATTTDPYSL